MSEYKPSAAVAGVRHGCLNIPRLLMHLLFKALASPFEGMRRIKLEELIAKERYPPRELVSLEAMLEKRIDEYVLLVRVECKDLSLKETRPYDPEALLMRFFKAQQAYACLVIQQKGNSSATLSDISNRIKNYENLIVNDVYFKILEKNGYVERVRNKIQKQLPKTHCI